MASSKATKQLKAAIPKSDLIGELKYHGLIGSGGSGEVYRVTWNSPQYGPIQAAAKVIRLSCEQTFDEQLGNEIGLLHKLQHENIIKYHGTVINPSKVVIVTELASKGSLFNHLKDKKRLPSWLKVKWAIELAKAIQYLREHNVVHRDVKSSNCVITSDDVLKLCDFGIAKDLTSTKTTETDKGTVKWLAPEVFTDDKISPKSDIFSFGIVLWELETCEEPYKGMRSHTVMFQVGVNGMRPEIPESCPRPFEELIKLCWHQNRIRRPNIEEVIETLESIKSNLPTYETDSQVSACHWISHRHLAICKQEHVDVFYVTTNACLLAYTLTSQDWKRKWTTSVAVSESMPDTVLVICEYTSHVYQFPCHQATEELKKFPIPGDQINPWCMLANESIAVISMYQKSSFLILSLPDFTQKMLVQTSVDCIYHLSIARDYLIVMGLKEMVLKPLGNVSQEICKVEAPNEWDFRAVSCTNNAKQIYAACKKGAWKGRVCKYILNKTGKPQYVDTGCVIDDIGWIGYRCLSMTEAWLTVGEWNPGIVKVYSLDYINQIHM